MHLSELKAQHVSELIKMGEALESGETLLHALRARGHAFDPHDASLSYRNPDSGPHSIARMPNSKGRKAASSSV